MKLASLGASGVCVLAIFWVGLLISKLPDTAGREKHKTMRLYMGMTIAIAVIAFVSGLANAWFNATAIAKVEKEKGDAEAATAQVAANFDNYKAETEETIAKYEIEHARNETVVKSLARVVDEKVLESRENGASDALKSHIKILRDTIESMTPDDTEVPE